MKYERRFQALDQGRPVQMEYVTDSGKDRLGILYEDIGRHSRRKTSSWLWRARRWHRSTPVEQVIPEVTDRLHALYGDGAGYVESWT